LSVRLIIVLMLSVRILTGCGDPQSGGESRRDTVRVDQRMGSQPDPGFARALEPRVFEFPRDHGAHPEFATEWWYFTGNLQDTSGRRFGYQLTLFRVGLKPGQPAEDSAWRAHQVYMGHMAISDMAHARHLSAERLSRSAFDLAGAKVDPLRIWLGPWSIEGGTDDIFPLRLKAATSEMGISLVVHNLERPMVLQGEKGLSQKGAEPGNASFYYSYTRLPTAGEILLDGQRFAVSGNSWFDREWSSSALAADQAGWDWFALQLDDGRDLMFYRMRGKDGRAQRFSRGILVHPDGSVIPLSHDQVTLEPTRHWTSRDQTRYPVSWRLRVPAHNLDLRVEAAFDAQEMPLTVRYWEGAVTVTGNQQGVGYLELSGYSR